MRSGFDAARVPAGLTRGLFTVASACLVIAAATHLLTYTPLGSEDALQTTSMVMFPVAFPVWGVMLFTIFLGRMRFDRVLSSLPVSIKVVGVLLLAYVAVDFFLMVGLLPGQPVAQGGKFFFDDHGLVPTTAAAYRQGLAYQARLITGHEMFFFGFAAIFGYQVDRLRLGKATLTESPIPAAGAIFSRGPFDRLVRLETALSPDQCASRLQSLLGRQPGWSLGPRLELWGSVSQDGFLLEVGPGSASSQLVFASGTFAQKYPGTRIEVLLEFKRWVVVAILATVVALPIVGVVVDAVTSGSHHFLVVSSALAVFGLVANLVFALYQRDRLLSFIERGLDAHRIETPSGPN